MYWKTVCYCHFPRRSERIILHVLALSRIQFQSCILIYTNKKGHRITQYHMIISTVELDKLKITNIILGFLYMRRELKEPGRLLKPTLEEAFCL